MQGQTAEGPERALWRRHAGVLLTVGVAVQGGRWWRWAGEGGGRVRPGRVLRRGRGAAGDVYW